MPQMTATKRVHGATVEQKQKANQKNEECLNAEFIFLTKKLIFKPYNGVLSTCSCILTLVSQAGIHSHFSNGTTLMEVASMILFIAKLFLVIVVDIAFFLFSITIYIFCTDSILFMIHAFRVGFFCKGRHLLLDDMINSRLTRQPLAPKKKYTETQEQAFYRYG